MSNFLYHSKYHRTNHHTLPTPGLPDSAIDPIASEAEPFVGPFYTFFIADQGTVPLNVKYILTYNTDYVTTFSNLSVATLDSTYLTLTANAVTNSYDWYRTRTNILTLSTGYSLYPYLTGTVISLSGSWNLGFSSYTTLCANSGFYESTHTTVFINSAGWPFIDTTLRLNIPQQNTKSKNFSLQTIIPSDADIYWDINLQQVGFVPLTRNSLLKNINPSDKKRGGEYYLIIQQDGYGEKKLDFESDFSLLASEIAPQISEQLVEFSTNEIWTSVYYGSGSWIAVPYNSNRASRSDDGGVSWYGLPLPGVKNWRSIVYGASAWVTIADSFTGAAVSYDYGTTWEYKDLLAARKWTSIGYNNNTFIAVASASNKGVRSVDRGVTWVEFALPFTADWASVKYGDGKWISVAGGGVEGSNPTNQGAISLDDGQTWDAFNLPSTRLWSDIAYGEDYWVAVAKNSTFIALSSPLEGNGQWFDYYMPGSPGQGFSSVTFGNETFVAASLNPTRAIYTSVDGKIWKYKNTVSKIIYNVNYGGTTYGGNFMMVGKDGDGTVTYSNYKIAAFDAPDLSSTISVLTAAYGVTVIKFVCDGYRYYGIPSVYYVSRGSVWTYFAGPGITLIPNPTDLLNGEGMLPDGGLTVAGAVVVDEGFTGIEGISVLSGMPV